MKQESVEGFSAETICDNISQMIVGGSGDGEEQFTAHNLLVLLRLGGNLPDTQTVRHTLRNTDWADGRNVDDLRECAQAIAETDSAAVCQLVTEGTSEDSVWVNFFAHTDMPAIVERNLASSALVDEHMRETLSLLGKHQHKIIAVDTDTPPSVLHSIGARFHGGVRTRVSVARNPNTPAALLEKFAEDKTDLYVLQSLLENPHTPFRIWEDILQCAEKGDRIAQQALSGFTFNQSAPPDMLRKVSLLRGDLHAELATHPNLPPETILELSHSVNLTVKEQLLKNPNLPGHIIQSMWNAITEEILYGTPDRNTEVPAIVNLPLEPENVTDLIPAIAQHPHTPETILRLLGAQDSSPAVKNIVLENPNTPEQTLRELALDPDVDASHIGYNLQAPENLYQTVFHAYLEKAAWVKEEALSLIPFILSERLHPEMLLQISRMPNCHRLEILSALALSERAPDTLLRNLAVNSNFGKHWRLITEQVVANLNSSAETLDTIAHTMMWEDDYYGTVAYALAHHNNVSKETLSFLLTQNFGHNDNRVKYFLKRKLGLINFHDYPMFAQPPRLG